jgi:stage III sporulation protein AD
MWRGGAMDIIKIAVLGIAACLLAIHMRGAKPEYELFVTLGACLCIFFFLFSRLGIVLAAMERMQAYIKLDFQYLSILIRMVGITYVAEFSANLCKDAGYHSVAAQIEMFGKISILAMSMPVLLALFEMIGTFLS